MKKEYHCIMPFIDESDSFVHGYECGTIAEKVKSGETLVNYICHTENSAQIQMICDLYKVKCEIKVIDETWSTLTTNKKQ